MRLSQCIAQAGMASRRKADALIQAGRVTVNGDVVNTPYSRVNPLQDRITVDGALLKGLETKVYYILHKPTGYLCSARRFGHQKIIYDLIEDGRRLFTAGRLDKETSGLIILTNDGAFSQRLIHPSSNIEKEYVVRVDKPIQPQHLSVIRQGALVEGAFVIPKNVWLEDGSIHIVVMEGKKHEVRHLVKKAHLQVLALHRIRIGGLSLGPLVAGAYRLLDAEECLLFFA